jgi:hypothetical protein
MKSMNEMKAGRMSRGAATSAKALRTCTHFRPSFFSRSSCSGLFTVPGLGRSLEHEEHEREEGRKDVELL